jgi:predicted transcriptional regulator
MPKNARSDQQRAFHLQEIARLYLQEKRSQAEIAEALGITQQQVSYDLKILQGQWRESAKRSISEAQAEEIARIDALERTYWDAWVQSLTPAETHYTEQLREPAPKKGRKGNGALPGGKKAPEAGDLVKSRMWMRRQGSHGDPRFLEGIRWCIAKRSEILGLNGPVSDGTEEDTTKRVTDDQRAGAIAHLLGRLRSRVSPAPVEPGGSVAPPGGTAE